MAHRPRCASALQTLILLFTLVAGAQPAVAIIFNDPEEDPIYRTPTPLPKSEYYLSPSRVPIHCRWRSGASLLRCWLNAHPEVGDHIRWRLGPPPNTHRRWDLWTEDVWSAFVTEFDKAMDWYTDCLVPAPGGGKKIGPCGSLTRFQSPLPKGVQGPLYFGVKVSETVARRIYFSYVANALALQMTGAVPWSITSFTDEQLARLLDFDYQVVFTPDYEPAYEGWYTHGNISPANATAVVQFLRANDILRPTQTATIGALIQWANRLEHYFTSTPGEQEDATEFWGPSAPPVPLASMLNGTEYSGPHWPAYGGIRHWTAGCYGTTWFLEDTLRAINLPVEPVETGVCGHTTPHFMTIDKYLSHGDDPYDTRIDNDPPIPGTELLISAAKFNDWFPEPDPDGECSHNVSRRAAQVAIEYLSDGLLYRYCHDVAGGPKHNHATGWVYAALEPHYSLKTLEAIHLWENLALKAAILGSCD